MGLLLVVTGFGAQAQTVSGRVVSETDQESLPGVNVLVKGTTSGTVTDLDGNYRLNAEGNDTLTFSYIGFVSQQVPVNNRSTVDIALSEDVETLSEVVVVGYGTQKKSDLTGAVSSVKAEDITRIGAGIPSEALQGKVAGVNVTPSGVPGQAPKINIRGVGTLGNSDPLFVVDGVFLDDISFLNNNDIQSMEVLKDASATAIYGSRGANGVVIITTKQGEAEQPTFSLNAYEGVQHIISNNFEMVNAREYGQLINEGLTNAGEAPVFNPDTLGVGTNWFDEIYRTAPIRDYQLSFNQSTDRSSYFVSAGYFKQQGALEKSDFERYTVRLNNSYKLTDAITIGHNLSGSWFTSQNPNVNAQQSAYRVGPIVSPRLPSGDFSPSGNTGSGNPVAAIDYTNDKTSGLRVVGNVYGQATFLNDFTFKTSVGIDLRDNQNRDFNPSYFVSPSQQNPVNNVEKNWEKWFDWLWENTLTWDKTIGIHRFNVLGGITSQKNSYETLGGKRFNIASENEDLWYLNAGDVEGGTNQNYALRNTIASYLFRANYTLLDKYLFTATFRADGSSRFPPGKRWGYFPSFALGWNISEEAFLANATWLDNLKLRASWGQIGNQDILDYQYYARAATGIDYVALFNNGVQPGSTITQLSNDNITWETATQTDIGLEVGLLEGALSLEADYYHRRTDDILVNVPVPGSVGLESTDGNVGSVLNRGLDLSARYQKTMGDFSFTVGLIGTTIYNEVLDLGAQEELQGGNIGAGNSVTRARVGQPIGYFYGYKAVGVFQDQAAIDRRPTLDGTQPGDLIFEDVNGDGEITDDDRTLIGSPIPKFTGGLNLNVSYKNVDLSVDLAGVFGYDIYNAKRQIRFSGLDNFDTSFLDRWTGPGTSDTEPRLTLGAGQNYFVSSRFVENGDFVKLRNVQLGYTLPTALLGKWSVQSVRVYISGNNLLYLTKYNGFTPEIDSSILYDQDAENANDATGRTLGANIDRVIYPVTSVYKVGLNVTF